MRTMILMSLLSLSALAREQSVFDCADKLVLRRQSYVQKIQLCKNHSYQALLCAKRLDYYQGDLIGVIAQECEGQSEDVISCVKRDSYYHGLQNKEEVQKIFEDCQGF